MAIEEYSHTQSISLSVKWDIEAKIIKGEYEAGDKLPTIVEMMQLYGIGKSTAQKIITELYDDGIIVKEVGSGCFVKPFVKDKLFEKHENILKSQILGLMKEAYYLGVDKNTAFSVLSDYWDELAEKEEGKPVR